MWDQRYADKDYVYGTEPNDFLREYAGQIKGPVLSLAEGEGRNAVYLASLGLDVLGVDSSAVGLQKAQALATSKQLTIQTEVVDLADFMPASNLYGSVVSISAHLPSVIRHRLYPLIEQSLKPGGLLILEAYAEEQLERETGGPKDIDMLMSLEKIQTEWPTLTPVVLQEVTRNIVEGKFHTGEACVIQFIGQKPL
ncbi:class I SAM-dependent methyltransferase [Neptunicella marina]|uniref:Class I SAM-dependent methyltransferase n=1 Tax=Neptunicella marina TaxID=2125989 RepID=A0A8J6IUT0_9ALTE|nr:class I SAM-dependent methyltransferase [Neptunicella marina]MBC3767101.1 class I SAM-dependent methyltransferase [Neptunicella marina]